MKIAVYAISKNEEAFVKRFCESAKDADLILIADTGSTDNTVKFAQESGAVVNSICISPWRFDKARDAALAMIPADYDICISLDLDEVLNTGWREEIERVWKSDTTRLRYKYDWSQDIVFYSEKIHARKGYYWKHPCHEYIFPDPRTVEVWENTDMLLVNHYPDETKSRGQYFDLLKVAVQEDKTCPRNAFYYARELSFYGHWEEAITALNNYLDMPTATWANERAYAMRLLGKCYQNLNDVNTSLKWYRLAVAEDPSVRETWLDLAMGAYHFSLWRECYHAAMSALAINERQYLYTADPASWTEKPYDLASIGAWNLGLKTEAIELCQQAIKFNPTDVRLIKNLEQMIEVTA